MKTKLDCYSCFLRIALQCARLAGADESKQKQLMLEALEFLGSSIDNESPLAVAHGIQENIRKSTGCTDPYRNLKEECNRVAGLWVPELEKILKKHNSLETALKISVLGNIMDYGAFSEFDLDSMVHELEERTFAVSVLEKFEHDLLSAKTLTYFADNTGEICFDGILIAYLCHNYALERVNLVIRKEPFLNDVAFKCEIPDWIRNLPKVCVHKLSVVTDTHDITEWSELSRADIVLAKGMANFENYSDDRRFSFLLISKCELVSSVLSEMSGQAVKTGDWILYQNQNKGE